MIASQAVSTVIMPLLIVLLLIMLNSSKTVGSYKNPRALNVGLIVTLAFVLFVSYSGALGLIDNIREILRVGEPQVRAAQRIDIATTDEIGSRPRLN